jgi:mono/diheme cytochrome c family protein
VAGSTESKTFRENAPILFRSFAISAILGFGFLGPAALADDSAKQAAGQQSATAPAGEVGSGLPAATAESAAKGELKSPYSDFAKVADEGHKKFMAAGCNGCHGGGGGGMGPPLTNQVWIYGKDDDTLFRLVALGSDGLQQGYHRKGSENVVGANAGHGRRRQERRRSVEDHRLDPLGEPVFSIGIGGDRPADPIAGLDPDRVRRLQ